MRRRKTALLFDYFGKLQAPLKKWDHQILTALDFALLIWQSTIFHCRFDLQELIAEFMKVFLVVLRICQLCGHQCTRLTNTLLLVFKAAIARRIETSFSQIGVISGDKVARKSYNSCNIP